MTTSRFQQITGAALGLIALRGAAVAVNFGVMLGLSVWLGLAAFGALAHLWALAMVVSTLVAAGGPLVILRARPDQAWRCFVRVGVLHPCGLAVLAASAVWVGGFGLAWQAVLAMGLAIAFAQGVASLLRVWGSVSLSMLVRDVVPVLALGCAALWPAAAAEAVLRAAVLLTVVCAVALVFGALRYGAGAARDRTDAQQGSLWLSSILGMGQAQADLVIAGLFLPVEVFGLYALLRRVANLVALPVTVATWVCAGPVASAFAKGDDGALARATAQASAIAWYPALGLLVVAGIGLAGLGAMQLPFLPPAMLPVFAVLLCGALLQAYWAASYPVANLGPSPVMAVEARGIALILYALMAVAGGAELGALGHALAYTLAMAMGGFHLWRRLWRAFALDTSARVLWRRAGAA